MMMEAEVEGMLDIEEKPRDDEAETGGIRGTEEKPCEDGDRDGPGTSICRRHSQKKERKKEPPKPTNRKELRLVHVKKNHKARNRRDTNRIFLYRNFG